MVFIRGNPWRVWRQKKFPHRSSDNFGSAYFPQRPKTFVRPRPRAPASVPPDSFFFCHCHSPSLFFSRRFDDEVHHLLNICTKRRLGCGDGNCNICKCNVLQASSARANDNVIDLFALRFVFAQNLNVNNVCLDHLAGGVILSGRHSFWHQKPLRRFLSPVNVSLGAEAEARFISICSSSYL